MADDALNALKKHNEQLSALLTEEGLVEIKRAVLLETALHAFIDGRLSEYGELPGNMLLDQLQTEFPNVDPSSLSEDMGTFITVPDTVKNVGKKVGSVANSYVKKKAGGILGGDDDSDDG